MTHLFRRKRAAAIVAITTVAFFTASVLSNDAEGEKSSEHAEIKLPSPLTWPPGQVFFAQSETSKKIRAALEKPIEFAFLDTPLSDVAAWIQKRDEISVMLDAEALAADGKGSELPFTRSGNFTSLANGLSLMLEGQGLCYVVKHDVLLITTKTAASQTENLSTRVYQVHDLVVAPNDPTASQPDFESLIELIIGTVRMQDWTDNGGSIGWIRNYTAPGILALIATHDEKGHREIEQLLRMLRESRLQSVADAQERQPFRERKQVTYPQMNGGTLNPPSNTGPGIAPASTTPPTTSGGGNFCN
jgi:hypothetical protein